jgi:hypothetical protein
LVGTSTDADGQYSLVINNPSKTDVLIFSFIGFFHQELPIEEKSQIDAMMKLDKTALEEMIIVGGMINVYRWYSPRGIWYKVKGFFRRKR